MEELGKEDSDFLEVLAGRREGTSGEAALRAELLHLARATREGEIAAGAELTPTEVKQRERLREALISAGALPRSSAEETPTKPHGQGFLSGLLGLLRGGKSSAGVLSWQSPAGAMGWMAVGCAAAFFLLPRFGDAPDEVDLLRGAGSLTISARDTGAKCAELEAALLGAGLPRHHITVSKPGDNCKVVVTEDDPGLQQVAAKIVGAALVKPSARIELDVILER